MDNRQYHYVECECGLFEDVLRFSYFDSDPELYVEKFSSKHLLYRLKNLKNKPIGETVITDCCLPHNLEKLEKLKNFLLEYLKKTSNEPMWGCWQKSQLRGITFVNKDDKFTLTFGVEKNDGWAPFFVANFNGDKGYRYITKAYFYDCIALDECDTIRLIYVINYVISLMEIERQ